MKVKLDENLGNRGAGILRAAGHDVTTVVKEGLSSASDDGLIEVCRSERRCLVTLDLDFGNPLRFEPSRYSGIAVLRLLPKSMAGDLFSFLDALEGDETSGLVEPSIHTTDDAPFGEHPHSGIERLRDDVVCELRRSGSVGESTTDISGETSSQAVHGPVTPEVPQLL